MAETATDTDTRPPPPVIDPKTGELHATDPATGKPRPFTSDGDLDPKEAGERHPLSGSPLRGMTTGRREAKYEHEREALTADARKQFEAGETAAEPYRQKLMKEYETPMAARAYLQKVADAPKPEDYKKGTMEFMASMALVGAFFGRGSRNSGNAALKAFAGAMKGWREGNQQAYADATKQWEEETKKTIQNNNAEIEKYTEIAENKKLNTDQLLAAMHLAAQPFQNRVAFDMTMTKNLDGSMALIDRMKLANAKLENATANLDRLREHEREQNESKATWWLSPTGQRRYKELQPEERVRVDQLIRLSGGKRLTSEAAARQEMEQETLERTGRMPTSEETTKWTAKFRAGIRTETAFDVGKQGDAIRAFNVSIEHLGTMNGLIDALGSGDTMALNRMQNLLSRQFGSGAVPSFEFAKEVVGDEITKAIMNTGVGSVTDRVGIKKQLDAASSPEALRDVIATAKKLMAGQLGGYRRQFTSGGGTEEDFEKKLSPNARRELGGLGGGGGDGDGDDGWGEPVVH